MTSRQFYKIKLFRTLQIFLRSFEYSSLNYCEVDWFPRSFIFKIFEVVWGILVVLYFEKVRVVLVVKAIFSLLYFEIVLVVHL